MSSPRGHQRREFPLSVRKLAFARCCKNGDQPGVPQCENCGIVLKSGNIEYEHIVPDGLGGEPTLENCGVWCRSSCSKSKTHREDNPRMQKADRVAKKAFGLTRSKPKIMSAGFRRPAPQRSASRPLQKRSDHKGCNPHLQMIGDDDEMPENGRSVFKEPTDPNAFNRTGSISESLGGALPLVRCTAVILQERGAA